ncbi:MAG: copper amine oxidase N-terminal domain-containing protein [Eubacteriales bacterium]|nr:copper amine oxidase N-terminal domain-containing protein [Eubacteriales bacterium]
MKKTIALLLILCLSFSMLTYTVLAADDEEQDIEDVLTEDTLEEVQNGAAPEGFDPDAAQVHRDDVFDLESEVEGYIPTDLTLEEIKQMFGLAVQLDDIQIYINGVGVFFPDTKPQLIADRTLVPVRIVAEQLGANVDWNEQQQMVTITRDDLSIVLKINNQTVNVNGNTQTLDVPAMVIADRTMVPFRFIFETFNMDVDWSEQTVNGSTYTFITANDKNY